MQQIWQNSLVCVHTGEMGGEQFANQAPWSQLHRRDKWEKLKRSGSADGWGKSGCQNDLWLYEVWHQLTAHTQAYPGTHTQVHRHVLKWNLCALGVSVERVWWRLAPEEVQSSFLCVSPLKTWALKGKTISFLDGAKEAQGYWRFHLSVNKQKDTGGSVNSFVQTLKMYTLQEAGEILRREPWDGVRGWGGTGICGLEPHTCQMPLPQDKLYGWELPAWIPRSPEALLAWMAGSQVGCPWTWSSCPPRYCTWPGCGAREALSTGGMAHVQAPSGFKRSWPCWYHECRKSMYASGSRLTSHKWAPLPVSWVWGLPQLKGEPDWPSAAPHQEGAFQNAKCRLSFRPNTSSSTVGRWRSARLLCQPPGPQATKMIKEKAVWGSLSGGPS